MNFGFVTAAAQLGIESVLFKPKRGIFSPTGANQKVYPDIIAQATIKESHHDRMEVTHHPVEKGSSISDHAFKLPAQVTLELGWSNSPTQSDSNSLGLAAAASFASANSTINSILNVAAIAQGAFSAYRDQSSLNGGNPSQINAIYQQLLQMQAAAALFTLYTGKRKYDNMICKTLVTETDAKQANSLIITMHCEEIILVNTRTVPLPKGLQKDASKTASPVNKGTLSATPK